MPPTSSSHTSSTPQEHPPLGKYAQMVAEERQQNAAYLDSHVSRIIEEKKKTKQPRLGPMDGRAAGEYLLDQFAETQHPPPKRNDPKWQMFSEIVMRCAHDAAGNMHAVNEAGKKWNGFDDIFKDFISKKDKISAQNQEIRAGNEDQISTRIEPDITPLKSYPKGSPWRKVLDLLPLYRKGIVQTPHPTETLKRKAIDAENALHHAIDECHALFAKDSPGLSSTEFGPIKDAMTALYEEMVPVKKSMDISEEMARSIIFSELAFNAIPHMMQGVIDPAVRQEARNTAPLTQEELQHFYYLLQPTTWSPGDRDSKPDMTTEKLEDGLFMNYRSMHVHYAFKLAEMIAEMKDRTVSDGRPDTKEALRKTLHRELATIQEKGFEDQHIEHHQAKTLASLVDTYLTYYHSPNSVSPKAELFQAASRILRDAVPNAARFEPYENAAALMDELKSIKSLQRAGAQDFPMFNGSKVLNKLDVLLAQMHSFGDYALRVQIRENATMHEQVMNTLAGLLSENVDLRKIPKQRPGESGEEYEQRTRSLRKARAEELLKAMGNTRNRLVLQHRITHALDEIRPELGGMKGRLANPDAYHDGDSDPQKATDKSQVQFYETLSGFALAAKHPDAIPQYLIAECRSSADILEAFALLKLMEPEKVTQRVDIVPLVEHRGPVSEIGTMLEEAYKNRYFREHHEAVGREKEEASFIRNLIGPDTIDEKMPYKQKISVANAKRSWLPENASEEMRQKLEETILPTDEKTMIPKISVADVKREKGEQDQIEAEDKKHFLTKPETKLSRHLTVADVKSAFGLVVDKKRDHKRLINHTKMVMFAGSDIMKSAGPAAAALVQHQIEALREQMLEWPEPVLLIDYTGSGGGVHRSQPVSTSFETVQGRSMRQTSESIAQKAITTMSRFLKRMLGFKDTAQQYSESEKQEDQQKANRLAQLNLGNLAGFKAMPDLWEQTTKKRCDAWIKAYEDMYHSNEFACMLAYSAEKFVRLASYAARPNARTDAKKDTSDYPPIVDVEKLRAIGYGASLNVSGSCASLYYGASEFLNSDAINRGDTAQLEALCELYLGKPRKGKGEPGRLPDPKAQDAINRATFGVVMADLDTAWEYLGCKRSIVDGEVLIGKESCAEIAHDDNTHIRALKRKDRNKLKEDEKYDLAKHMLAKVDMEHQAVSKTLLVLHSKAAGKECPSFNLRKIQENIMDRLPCALKEQIDASRQHIKEARRSLAKDFHDSCKKKKHSLRKKVEEIREEEKLFDSIYYRMGVNFECFENAPRAYTRPFWALDLEFKKAQDPQYSMAP